MKSCDNTKQEIINSIIAKCENISSNYKKGEDAYYKIALSNLRLSIDPLCKYILYVFLGANYKNDSKNYNGYRSSRDKKLLETTKRQDTLINKEGKEGILQGVELIIDTKSVVIEKLKSEFGSNPHKAKLASSQYFPYFDYLVTLYSTTSFDVHDNTDGIDLIHKLNFSLSTIQNLFKRLAEFRQDFKELHFLLTQNLPDITKKVPIKIDKMDDVYLSLTRVFGNPTLKSYNVLILPPEIEDIKPKNLSVLSSIHWDIVIDFSFEKDSIIKHFFKESKKEAINVYDTNNKKESQEHPLASKPKINWIFGRGRLNHQMNWNQNNFSSLKKLLDAFLLANAGAYSILSLCSDHQAKRVISYLKDYFIDKDFKENKFVVFSNDNDEYLSLEQLKNVNEYGDEFINCEVRFQDLIRYLALTRFAGLAPDYLEADNSLSQYDPNFKDEDQKTFNSYGIYFYHSLDKTCTQEDIVSFYKGGNITRGILEGQFDAPRSSSYMEKLKKLVNDELTRNAISFISIIHEAGAGGSTLGWQLMHYLYNFNLKSINKDYIIGYIKEFKGGTEEALARLSEKLGNNKVIMLVDHTSVKSWEIFSKAVDKLRESQKNILFILMQRNNGYIDLTRNQLTLKSVLQNTEKTTFLNKYLMLPNKREDETENLNRLKNEAIVELVEFPLAMEGTNRGFIEDYVINYFNPLKEMEDQSISKFVINSSLLYVYGGKNLSSQLFGINNEILKNDRNVLKLMTQIVTEDNLLMDSTEWRPRNIKLANVLLERFSLEDIVIEFIKDLSDNAIQGEETKNILTFIFTNRQINPDSKKQKFTSLIESLGKTEIKAVDRVFEELIKLYPEEPHFLAQYGRYLFETAFEDKKMDVSDQRYVKAREKLEQAMEMAPDDYSILHMAGIFYTRVLLQYMSLNRKNHVKEPVYEQDILKFGRIGRELLLRSSKLSSNDSFPIAALGNLSKYMLREYFEIHGKNSPIYDLENDLEFSDYLMDLDDVIQELKDFLDNNKREDSISIKIKDTEEIYKDLLVTKDELYGEKEKAKSFYRNMLLQHGIRPEQKIRYTRKWIDMSLLIKKDQNSLRSAHEAMKFVDKDELEDILRGLQGNISEGDLQSFKIYFDIMRLNPHKRGYTVEDAISDLVRWRDLAEKQEDMEAKAEALYFLGVCYAIMALESDRYEKILIDTMHKYFKESKEIACTLSIPTGLPKYYLLKATKDDQRLSFSRIGDNDRYSGSIREFVEGRLVPENKILTPTGVDISLGGKKLSKDSHEKINKQDFIGMVGFRYEGPGLYTYFEKGQTLTMDDEKRLNENEAIYYWKIQEKIAEIENYKRTEELDGETLTESFSNDRLSKKDNDSQKSNVCSHNPSINTIEKSKYESVKKDDISIEYLKENKYYCGLLLMDEYTEVVYFDDEENIVKDPAGKRLLFLKIEDGDRSVVDKLQKDYSYDSFDNDLIIKKNNNIYLKVDFKTRKGRNGKIYAVKITPAQFQ